MIDVFNRIDDMSDVQIFYGTGATADTGFLTDAGCTQAWYKPPYAKMVMFYLIGGGGGGGSGRSSTASQTAGGGGGGSSGAVTIGLYQACLLPDTLFVSVGLGGSGGPGPGSGSNGSTGNNGTASYIFVNPQGRYGDLLLLADYGAGGGGGTTGVAAVGGAAPPAYNGAWPFSFLGQVYGWNGKAGGNGGTGAALPPAITLNMSITGGGGGGGCTSTGGTVNSGANITGAGIIPTVSGGPSGGNVSSPGANGFALNMPGKSNTNSRQPCIFLGGAGGGSIYATVANTRAGAGGNGSYGCGGGGGGGGNAQIVAGLGGAGGRGGDGLVIITSF